MNGLTETDTHKHTYHLIKMRCRQAMASMKMKLKRKIPTVFGYCRCIHACNRLFWHKCAAQRKIVYFWQLFSCIAMNRVYSLSLCTIATCHFRLYCTHYTSSVFTISVLYRMMSCVDFHSLISHAMWIFGLCSSSRSAWLRSPSQHNVEI